ncbi:MAG: SDR family NAD(P)-dependent oxidoreductase, partial [Rhodobacteraceae bacterium]|nr:SDR family NAD(P)-dependent oxidoreductase [Paracoccaceae bacterium]MCB2144061.1 SDR family NAD(P)-dependent oxidoreductase [Paracoccaceae bacterium]
MSGTIVVTGASAGIGRGVARRFLAEGWNVALLARRSEVLREVADGAPNALPVVCDVSDAGAV